jgi:hypothetical protein
MNYSKIHAHVAEYDAIDRDEILNEPQNYFGPNYQTVLNFWWFVESLQEEHLEKITELYDKEFEISNFDGEIRLLNIAEQRIDQDFLSSAIGDCICEEIPHSDYSIRQSSHGAIFHATCELIAMDIIFERGEALVYVPMFDFTKEETKEEPPLSGEIFDMQSIRPRTTCVSTPNGVGIGYWIQQFTNNPITHNYYQYSRSIPQE